MKELAIIYMLVFPVVFPFIVEWVVRNYLKGRKDGY